MNQCGEKQLPLLFEQYGKILSCKKGQSIYIQDYEAEAFYMVKRGHFAPLSWAVTAGRSPWSC